MAKYEVKFSCGHTETVELFKSEKERKSKIAYFEEKGMCKECYKAQQEKAMGSEHDEVEMSYSEYKNNYSANKTKKDSYNANTKTIVVYMKKA